MWEVSPPWHSPLLRRVAGLWLVLSLAVVIAYSAEVLQSLAGLVLLVVAWIAGVMEFQRVSISALRWERNQWLVNLIPMKKSDGTAGESTVPGQVHVVMDLQFIVLARVVDANDISHFLWLCQHTDPSQWHRLRCALFAGRQP